MTTNALPLTGWRVLEISTAWAGPMLGRILCDLGADVVKLESLDSIDNWRGAVKGDDRKRYPLSEPGLRPYNRNAWFNTQNMGKHSVGVDLKSPLARSAVEELVKSCDALICNFAAGALKRMKLDYAQLVKINPKIILLEMVVTGEGGPLENTRGVGPTMEALAGMTVLTGYGDGVPQRTGPAYVDPIGALNGAMAILLATRHRQQTGEGQRIELAQRESLMNWYGERFILAAVDGIEIPPLGNRSSVVAPHDAFQTMGDDEWIAIAVSSETQWIALCEILQKTNWIHDPRFANAESRIKNSDALNDLITEVTKHHDKLKLAFRLQQSGVCAAPVNNGKDIFEDPHLIANQFMIDVEHPEAGVHRYQGLPFHFEQPQKRRQIPAPLLGQHTRDILKDWAGLNDQTLDGLIDSGACTQA